ncbi:DUF805 domain-containing protein [Escherichia coli]|nr:DUF805 domain-containing protein [Escherichia coli]
MTFLYYIKNSLKNLNNFKGRARRSEYWYYQLGVLLFILLPLISVLIIAGVDKEIVKSIGVIVHGLLSISVTIRRLHDTDRSGWCFLLNLIPIIGGILLFIFMCQRGTIGENRFGKDPKSDEKKSLNIVDENKPLSSVE